MTDNFVPVPLNTMDADAWDDTELIAGFDNAVATHRVMENGNEAELLSQQPTIKPARQKMNEHQTLPPRNNPSDRSVRLAPHPSRSAAGPRRNNFNRRSSSLPFFDAREELPSPPRRRVSPSRKYRDNDRHTSKRRSQSPAQNNSRSEPSYRTRPLQHENRNPHYDDDRNADTTADESYESAVRERRNNQKNSSSSSRDSRRPPKFNGTSHGREVRSLDNRNYRSSSSSAAVVKRRRGGNAHHRRNVKRSKRSDSSSDERGSGPPRRTTAVQKGIANETAKKVDDSTVNDNDNDNVREELKEAQKSMDYVSLVNIAKSRHTEEFMDLKGETLPAKFGASRRMSRHRFIIYTRDENGNKDKKLQAIGEASKIKEAKQDAARKLLLEMLKINPKLQYQHGKVKKAKKVKQDMEPAMGLSGRSAKSIVEELRSANVLIGETKYSSQEAKTKQTDEDFEPNVCWQSTLAVILAENNEQFTTTGIGSKKKDAEQDAAQQVLNELLDRKIEKAIEVIGRVPKKKEEIPKTADCKALETPPGIDVEDGDQSIVEDEANKDLFDNPEELFTFPQEYKVNVGHNSEDCEIWLENNVFYENAPIGVYLESGKLLNSIAPEGETFEVTECSSICISTSKGALLVVEDDCGDEWPPDSIKRLLEGNSVSKAGYMCSAAQLEDVRLAPILDIQDYSYSINPPSDAQMRKLSLKQLVRRWGSKKFTPFDLKQVSSATEEIEQLEELVGERVRPAVHVACATLAVLQAINRQADARIRGQIGVAAIPGFLDLANQLFLETGSRSGGESDKDDEDECKAEDVEAEQAEVVEEVEEAVEE